MLMTIEVDPRVIAYVDEYVQRRDACRARGVPLPEMTQEAAISALLLQAVIEPPIIVRGNRVLRQIRRSPVKIYRRRGVSVEKGDDGRAVVPKKILRR